LWAFFTSYLQIRATAILEVYDQSIPAHAKFGMPAVALITMSASSVLKIYTNFISRKIAKRRAGEGVYMP
jgi:hypothetical protein